MRSLSSAFGGLGLASLCEWVRVAESLQIARARGRLVGTQGCIKTMSRDTITVQSATEGDSVTVQAADEMPSVARIAVNVNHNGEENKTEFVFTYGERVIKVKMDGLLNEEECSDVLTTVVQQILTASPVA